MLPGPLSAAGGGYGISVMARYWVVGGEYADVSFERLAQGAREERLGPYASYGEAYAVWQARARATVDDALVRFRIIEEGGDRLAS